MKKQKKSLIHIVSAATLAVAAIIQLFPVSQAFATQIEPRSLTLVAGAGGDGGSLPGGTVNHLFNFSLPSSDSLGSIKFQYCTTAAAVPGGIDCNLPGGIADPINTTADPTDAMDTTGATLGSESGVAGFSISTGSPNGTIIMSRTASTISPGTVSYQLNGIVNPNLEETFFVRISTYGSTDGTGTPIDTGTVAAATNYAINLDGTMPESLVFCTGKTISDNAGNVPDCSTATLGTISFDRLFSPTDTATATSQMAASTNAGFGYSIAVHGPTLTSGGNTVAAMNTATTSIRGTPQFGLNLVQNTTTASTPFGAPVTQTGGALYTGTPATDYGTAETFKYLDGDTVAASTGGSDAQIFTVAYMANVSGSQPAGTYATTLTYICTPKF